MHPTDPVDAPPSDTAAGSSSLGHEAKTAALHAARYAAAAYDGPIGELISREIRSYVEADEQLPSGELAPRLVSAMTRREVQHPLPPLGNRAAPRYVPGSPMHWRYLTAADEPDPSPGER